MIRPSYLFLAVAGLLAAPVSAQLPEVRRVGGNAQLVAFVPGSGQVMSGIPKSYKDSVLSVWARRVADFPAEVQAHIAPGAQATLVLRLLRNGNLHRVRLDGSLGDHVADSLLLAGAHDADEARLFPAFPPGVDGAGTEIRIVVSTPIPASNRVPSRVRNVDVPAPSPACADSLAVPTSVRNVRLGTGIDSITGGEEARTWGGSVMQALAEGWHPIAGARPRMIPSMFRERTGAPDGSVLVQAWVRLAFDGTGHLLDASIRGPILYPAIDSALVAAAWRADSARAFPPPTSTRGDTAIVDLEVTEGNTGANGRILLGAASVAFWEVQVPPGLVSAGQVRYPAELKSQRIGGRVETEFVVGTEGWPIASTITILSSPHIEFDPAVIAAISASRFTPGRIRGCAIPVLVRQAVNFNP